MNISITYAIVSNTLSPRTTKFRESFLAQQLSAGLCDPDRLHGLKNNVIIADCPIDRKDEAKVSAYLCKKYRLDHLQTIPMNKITAKIAFPENLE